MSFERRAIKTRQCYICFKKFDTIPTKQIKCCSEECYKKYKEYMHVRRDANNDEE